MNIEGKTLDEYQTNAIKANNKSTLLVAGAGSGKTLTILGKIKYLLEIGYKEDEILCISFTNKSVNDLKERLLKLNMNIEVLTFHKLGLNLLQNNNYSLCSDNYLEYIIDEFFESYIKYNNKNLKELKRMLYEENTNKLFSSSEYYKLKKTIYTFIKLAKTNDVDINYILNIYKKEHFKNKIILKYIIQIYEIYKNDLESSNKIDFDDIIIKAKDNVKNLKLKYKYIIIDEFQDSSLLRINLIKEVIKYTNSNLFVVGDDYQSIYRFSGCNLKLFLNFKDYFEDAKIFYLKNTYRCPKELIDISTNFIMKNKKQFNKIMYSNKSIKKPIKLMYDFKIDELINYIGKDNLLILGRNNKDIEDINFNNKLTIHSSKGLEANNIIIVNQQTIPNKIKNEKILKYVTFYKDYVMYEEERRLFYVALTRTKNNVYILMDNKKSPFVKELIRNYKKYIEVIHQELH